MLVFTIFREGASFIVLFCAIFNCIQQNNKEESSDRKTQILFQAGTVAILYYLCTHATTQDLHI